MNTKLTYIIIILLTLSRVQSQTVIPGGDVSGEWKIDGSPYLIEGNIHILSGQKLSIDAGVEIRFEGSNTFEIEGKIEAIGTETDSITFTLQDTTGFSQGITTGWYGLSFTGYNYSFNENSVLNYCIVEYSEMSGLTCISYPYLTLENSSFRFNKNAGISLYQFSDIEGENIRITNNGTGGIITVYSSPSFSNYNVLNNEGTGISLYGNSASGNTTTFFNGKISGNNGGATGGGVLMGDDSYVVFEQVEIIGNSSESGGGIYCSIATGMIRKAVIMHNHAQNGGGVFCSMGGMLDLEYSLIARNTALVTGGGASVTEGTINLQNCTLSGNSAGEIGGGMYYDLSYPVTNQVTNCILWDNQPEEIGYTYELPSVGYSDIKGGFAGTEIFDADPLFLDPVMSDYHLTWSNFPQENGIKSPCIDAGNPDTEPDPDGTTCDLGAFYFDQGFYTAVTPVKSINEISIFPNPSQHYISINGVNRADHVKLFSLDGRSVLAEDIVNENQTIDISFLKEGFYILNLYEDNDIIGSGKFIKE